MFSFRPEDESEEIEANDDNEEAEEEEGRANCLKSSIRTPLAVTIHGLFHGCVSVMLCLCIIHMNIVQFYEATVQLKLRPGSAIGTPDPVAREEIRGSSSFHIANR